MTQPVGPQLSSTPSPMRGTGAPVLDHQQAQERVLTRLDKTWPDLMVKLGYSQESPIAAVRAQPKRWDSVRNHLWEQARRNVGRVAPPPLTEGDWYHAVVQEIHHTAQSLPTLYGDSAQRRLWEAFPNELRSTYQQRKDSLRWDGGVCLGLVQMWMEERGRLPTSSRNRVTDRVAQSARFYQASHNFLTEPIPPDEEVMQRGTALRLNTSQVRQRVAQRAGTPVIDHRLAALRLRARGLQYHRGYETAFRQHLDAGTSLAMEEQVMEGEFAKARKAAAKGVVRTTFAQGFAFRCNILGTPTTCSHSFGLQLLHPKEGPWRLRFFDPNVGEFEFKARTKRTFWSKLGTMLGDAPGPKSVHDFENFPEFFQSWANGLYDGGMFHLFLLGRATEAAPNSHGNGAPSENPPR